MTVLNMPESRNYIKLEINHELNTQGVLGTNGKPFYTIKQLCSTKDRKAGIVCRASPLRAADFLSNMVAEEGELIRETDLVRWIVRPNERGGNEVIYISVTEAWDNLVWIADQIEQSAQMVKQSNGRLVTYTDKRSIIRA